MDERFCWFFLMSSLNVPYLCCVCVVGRGLGRGKSVAGQSKVFSRDLAHSGIRLRKLTCLGSLKRV